MKKSLIVVSIIFALVLSMTAFVGCGATNNADGHDYKVTVLGMDGKPFTTAKVQICKVMDNGVVGNCFQEKIATDDQGVAYIDLGENVVIPEGENVNKVEVHLFDVPPYMTYDKKQIVKGEALTLQLKEMVDAIVGTGKAQYDGSALKTDETFDPYVTALRANDDRDCAAYKVAFSEENQSLFFEFTGDSKYAYKYRISVVGNVNVKITLLAGNKTDGITKSETSKSATGTSASLEFDQTQDIVAAGSKSYFELAFNGTQIDTTSFYVTFEYLGDVA